MAKKKLGKKYACYQCGCKFYDLAKPKPICPKCGANQKEAPAKEKPTLPKAGVAASATPRSRGRRRRSEEDSVEPAASFSDDEVEPSSLEDGLTMIDDEELLGSGGEELTEED
jgi:hypothetical protein